MSKKGSGYAYNLSVKIVFLDHDDVDSLGIFEGQKTKPSRAPGRAISHDSAFYHLSVLRKVVSK